MRAAALALAALLTACAIAPAPPQAIPSLPGVPQAFEMSGRLALRQGDRSEIARLRWVHRGASDVWIFASPLGNEVARIESGASGARLSQGGQAIEADTFADLTERAVGVAIDPSLLVGWLHGVEVRHGADWEVTIEESTPAGSVTIARRLTARRGDVTVRLVVDEYRPLEPGS
jgi:outer membrane biogenesis lipoprotein LolB